MKDIGSTLEKIVEEWVPKLDNLDKATVEEKPNPGKWSKKEILGHLVDSANNNINRFIRGQYEINPHIIYNQDAWVTVQHYQEMPFPRVIKLWKAMNLQLAHILIHMDPANHEKEVNTGKDSEELHNLYWLAEDYIHHLNHHLTQITEKINQV